MGTQSSSRWWSHPRVAPPTPAILQASRAALVCVLETNRAGLGAQSIYLEHSLSLERGVEVESLPINVPSSTFRDQSIH